MAFVAALLAVWLIVDPRTPDLAAQVYRVGLFRELGLAVWDEHWYAGHHLPGYSLLFGPLGALLGLRTVAVASVLASTLLFERVARSCYGDVASWGAALFGLAAAGDVWAGRLTFALGVALALGACLALQRGHPVVGAVVSALCAAASPVAGVLLGLVALTVALSGRSPRAVLVLGAPGAIVVLALAALFPEGGWEPFPLDSFAATVLVVAAFIWGLPAAARELRIGALLYLLICVLCLTIRTPMGSNIERYAVLLAAPLLLCAGLSERRQTGARRSRPLTLAGTLGLCTALVFVTWGPVRETLAVAGSKATSASYYAPLERFLKAQGGELVRVEVPLTRSHWEAAMLAPQFSLARGWEKQLETRFNDVLLRPGLDASSYLRWLQSEAIRFVAVPDVALDPSSAQEGRLIRAGLRYLRQVYAGAHWRVYRVLGAVPLASGPGRLTSLQHDAFRLQATTAGRFLVRVRFTRYWTLTQGSGCVRPAAGGWTAVTVDRPGRVVVAARFSLSRAFAPNGSCTSARSR
jgi:hypothetical protein